MKKFFLKLNIILILGFIGCGDDNSDKSEVEDDTPVAMATPVPIATPVPNINSSVLKKTGQTQSYTQAGTEVFDRSIKDDGFYQKGISSNYSRDNSNETVIDQITGLMWQDDSSVSLVTKQWLTQSNYDAGNYSNTIGDTATTYCDELVMGGHEDWRLPTRIELQDIADYGQSNPAINMVFTNIVSSNYWSSTSDLSYDGYAWFIYFYSGFQNYSDKTDSNYVRCVREGK